MSNAAPLPRHDFQDPRRPPAGVWKALTQWVKDAFHLTQETWQPLLTSPCTFEVIGVDLRDIREAVGLMPQPGVGMQFEFADAAMAGLLVFSQKLAVGLLADLLGDRQAEGPAPRELTDLEESLLAILFQQLATAFGETWPAAQPISNRFLEFVDRPHRTRLFGPDATVVAVRLKLKMRFGEEEGIWLLPLDAVESLLRSEAQSSDAGDRPPATVSEGLAMQLPATMVVELGRTRLKMSEIAALRVGDVIVLDQSISRLLQTSIGTCVKFRGSPGRVGPRQALLIESVVGDDAFPGSAS